MIVVVNAENRGLFEADLIQMYRQRKTVFVDEAGWKIPVLGDMEMDAYDRDDTIYLIAKDQPGGRVLASVRLLQTAKPHLMCELFSAIDREKIPRGATVWEVSRFCTAPGLVGRHRRHGLLWEIICGVLETGLLYGIDRIIFAASRALLPLALNCGWNARTLGQHQSESGDEVTAVSAAVTAAALSRVRRLHGVPIPAIRFPAAAPRQASDRVEHCPAVDGHQRSPLGFGQATPIRLQIEPGPLIGDLPHG